MPKTLRCSIVTPSESVFDGEVAYVSYQAWDGQQGIMVEQSPILAKLGIGSLRLDFTEGESRWYLLDGGFTQAGDGILTLLTENALAADSISLEEAKAELAEAAARVTISGEDRSRVDHDYQLALAKKSMAEMMLGRSGAS